MQEPQKPYKQDSMMHTLTSSIGLSRLICSLSASSDNQSESSRTWSERRRLR